MFHSIFMSYELLCASTKIKSGYRWEFVLYMLFIDRWFPFSQAMHTFLEHLENEKKKNQWI